MSDWLGMGAAPRTPRSGMKERVLARALTRGRRWSRTMLAVAAGIVLALAAGGYWTVRTVRDLRGEVAQLAGALDRYRDTLNMFLRSPASHVLYAPVTTNGRLGAVTILTDSVSRRWLVRCEGLAPNEPDETYQLWFMTDHGPRAAGLMPMMTSEPMTMTLEVPADSARVTGVAMSIEPRDGSTKPSGPVVFRLSL
jgi:anti-sigma-K factor RskA